MFFYWNKTFFYGKKSFQRFSKRPWRVCRMYSMRKISFEDLYGSMDRGVIKKLVEVPKNEDSTWRWAFELLNVFYEKNIFWRSLKERRLFKGLLGIEDRKIRPFIGWSFDSLFLQISKCNTFNKATLFQKWKNRSFKTCFL